MIEWITTALFMVLLVIPFFTVWSAAYLANLVRDAIQPPILLVLLTVQAIVSLMCSGYIATLVVNSRFLGNVNPPELVPITLVALIVPLAMVNVIALALRRTRGSAGTRGPTGATGPKGDTGAKGPTGATGPAGGMR